MPEDYVDSVGLAGDERFAEFRAWYRGLRRYLDTVQYLRGVPADMSPCGYVQQVAAALLQVTDLRTFPPDEVTDVLDTALGRAHFVSTPIEEHRWSLLRKCTVVGLSLTTNAWLANLWTSTGPPWTSGENSSIDIGEYQCMKSVQVAVKSPLREKRVPEITLWALRELYRADYEYLVALAAHAG